MVTKVIRIFIAHHFFGVAFPLTGTSHWECLVSMQVHVGGVFLYRVQLNPPLFLATHILTTLEVCDSCKFLLSCYLGGRGWGWGSNVHVDLHTYYRTCYIMISSLAPADTHTHTRYHILVRMCTHTHTGCHIVRSSLAFSNILNAALQSSECYIARSSLAFAHTQTHWMLCRNIFSCTWTHTHTWCISMLRCEIFSCTFNHSECYVLRSSLALAHTGY